MPFVWFLEWWHVCWLGLAPLSALIVFLSRPFFEAARDRSGDIRRFVSWSSDEVLYLFGSRSNKLQPNKADASQLYMSIIIPAFNETQRLPKCLTETMAFMTSRQRDDGGGDTFSFEIIVVDDGSSDGTGQAILRLREEQKWGSDQVRIIALTRNRGKGFSVRMGMLASRGRVVLMMDADGASRIGDMLRLERAMALRSIEDNESKGDAEATDQPGVIVPFGVLKPGAPDIAFGSRKDLEDEAVAVRKWYRNLLMYGFHFLVRAVVGSEIRDTQCGFKLFSRKAVHRIFPSLHLNNWAFDIEVLVVAKLAGFRVVEIPIRWKEIQGSKLNIVTATLQMARDIVLIKLLYVTGIWKLLPP